MKNLILLLLCAIGLVLTSCSKDNGGVVSGFTDAELEALQVFNGTFVNTTSSTYVTTIEFSPFDTPTEKENAVYGVTLEFHGEMKYQSRYTDNEYYFYIDTEDSQIVAYVKSGENNEYFNILLGQIWDYTIVDSDTIRLRDTDLSEFSVQTYTRQ